VRRWEIMPILNWQTKDQQTLRLLTNN